MLFTTSSVVYDIIGIILALVLVVITYFKWTYQYWKRENMPYIEPKIPFGNLQPFHKRTVPFGLLVKQYYDEMKPKKLKYFGIYCILKPMLVIMDLDLVKNLMTKDFEHFMDRGAYYNERDDAVGGHLFALEGLKWHNMRMKLSPSFTSLKLKTIFQTVLDCGKLLDKKIVEVFNKNQAINVKEIAGHYTSTVVNSFAFGLECKSLQEHNTPLTIYGNRIIDRTIQDLPIYTFVLNFPKLAYALHVRHVDKEVSDYFLELVESIVNYREINNIYRKDFLQYLIEIKNGMAVDGKAQQNLTIKEIVAQCYVFYIAGFETTALTLATALYLLAKHQEIQEKLRNEIFQVLKRHDGQITYESLKDMNYMNQVIDETLRLYGPAPLMKRNCTKDYPIPGTNQVIKKDTLILLPFMAIHHDAEYYPDPEKFDPDRFSPENKKTRHQYAHLPFGNGPRTCIGKRLAIMEMKVALTVLLRNYRYFVNSKTQEPLKFDVNSVVFTTDGGLWLDVEKL